MQWNSPNCRSFGLRALALSLACLVAPACTYLKEFVGFEPQQPKLHLIDIAVVGFSLSQLDLEVSLKVDNPNDFALDFAGLHYNLAVGGRAVASGVFDQPLHVPANASAPIKLPLQINTDAALGLVHELITKSTDVVAVLKATADFATPFGRLALDFEDQRPLRKLAGF